MKPFQSAVIVYSCTNRSVWYIYISMKPGSVNYSYQCTCDDNYYKVNDTQVNKKQTFSDSLLISCPIDRHLHLELYHLLSSLSQLFTLPFQSHVCLSTSKANPEGQLICFIPDFVHLMNKINNKRSLLCVKIFRNCKMSRDALPAQTLRFQMFCFGRNTLLYRLCLCLFLVSRPLTYILF
jgi:hypothetical protein